MNSDRSFTIHVRGSSGARLMPWTGHANARVEGHHREGIKLHKLQHRLGAKFVSDKTELVPFDCLFVGGLVYMKGVWHTCEGECRGQPDRG